MALIPAMPAGNGVDEEASRLPVPTASPAGAARTVTQAGPAAARPALALCVGAICLYWLSLYLFVPVLAPRAHDLGAGVAGVGLVLATYGFVQFLLRIPLGVWSDRIGKRQPFLVAAMVACGVAAMGMGVARTPLLLAVFRGVSGLGACGWVAITLLYAEFFPAERTGRALGFVGFLATGSQLAGTFAGGLVAQFFGFAAPFLGAAGIAAAGLLVSLAVRPAAPRAPRPPVPLSARLAAGRDRQVLTASALSIASHYLTFVTVYGFSPLLAATRFGAGGVALGVLSLAATVPSALASLGSGPLGERWTPRTVAVLGFVIAAVGTASLPFAPGLAWLDAASAAVGLGVGLLGPTLMTTAVQGFSPERRGAAMGFYQALYSIGMFGGPAVAGLIGARLGMGGLFLTTAALAAVAAAGSAAVLRRGAHPHTA